MPAVQEVMPSLIASIKNLILVQWNRISGFANIIRPFTGIDAKPLRSLTPWLTYTALSDPEGAGAPAPPEPACVADIGPKSYRQRPHVLSRILPASRQTVCGAWN